MYFLGILAVNVPSKIIKLQISFNENPRLGNATARWHVGENTLAGAASAHFS